MDCETFLRTVATKTLPELPHADRFGAITHLHGCKSCRHELATARGPMTKAEYGRMGRNFPEPSK